MPHLPFQLRYDLTRRQRLVPHLKIWREYLLVVAVCVGGSAAGVARSWWFILLLLFFLYFFRGFFIGLLNVALCRRQDMDVVVEPRGLGFLAGGERWWLFLDGLIAFDQLLPGVWTAQFWNGTVVNIPAGCLDARQVEFFREQLAAAKEGRRRLGASHSSPDLHRA